jgi:hypothetical protein
MRTLLIALVASAALTAPAAAQSTTTATVPAAQASYAAVHPSPAAHAATKPGATPTPFMTFNNPVHNKNLPTASGADCNRMTASTMGNKNPVNGAQGSQTLVSVPITKGGGSVASSTNRAQQRNACGH